MKLIIFLTLLFTLQATAGAFSQEVSLSVKNESLENVLSSLRKQSGYTFLFNSQYLKDAKPINLYVNKVDILDVLPLLFKKQPFRYEIENHIVTLLPKENQVNNPVQYESVYGKIVDKKGEPLAGATVKLKGSNRAIFTDQEGTFTLRNVKEGTIIVISYVGYNSIEVKAASNLGILTLALGIGALEQVEIINTGYQSLPKERATGAFGTVNTEQIEKPTVNIGQRLIGAVSGVQAKLDVDGNPTFEIRGQTSLYANSGPLIVVDGFAIQGGFNTINPNDVETITVLKDAAAASIWGARAANGVIVITTKRGNKSGGTVKVDLQAFTRIGSKFDLDYVNPLASSAETIEYEKMSFNKWGAQENSGVFEDNFDIRWSQATVALSEHHLGYITAEQRDATFAYLAGLDNRQQIKDNLLANPIDQQYNLTLSGSNDRMNTIVSLLYEKNQSNFQESSSEKYMMNYRNSSKVLKWLDFNTSAMLQYNNQENNGANLGDIKSLSPYDMLKNEDGSLTNISQFYWPIMERFVPMSLFPYSDWTYNPIQDRKHRSLNSKQLNARLMGGVVLKPLAGLAIESSFQYELFNTFNKNRYDDETFLVRNMINTTTKWDQATNKMTLNLPKGSVLNQNRNKRDAWILRNQLNYNRSFSDKHELNFVAGTEVNNFVTEVLTNPTTYGYNDETLTIGSFPNGPGGSLFPIQNWLGSNQSFSYTNSFSYRTERFLSIFSNTAYTFDRKYTLSGSIRTDASNMITDDPSYRYAPFWSIGGGWQMTKETFMKDVNWMDYLNLRLTYGYNGNVDKSTAFMPLINLNTTPNIYINDYTATISSYGNPTLRWEKTGTWNLGVDYTLFSGLLSGKIDVYNKQGKDLIARLSIPSVNGTRSQLLNNAEMTNQGFELELGTIMPLKGKDIMWRGNLSFSYNKNKVTKLFVTNYPSSILYMGGTGAYAEGYNANSMWMFEYAGVHDTQPMLKGEDGELHNFSYFPPGDGRDFMLNMGTKVAPYTFGFINSVKVYDFNLSFILTGKLGHVFKNMPFNYPETYRGRVLPNNKLSSVLNGDPSKIVPLPLNDDEWDYWFWNEFIPNLSYQSANASHFRMQEVNATYNLPVNKWRFLNDTRLSFYAQGNDLFTVLFNDAKEDPEYQLGTMKPSPKFTFGLRIGL